jgi:hypothetical protein
MIIGDSSAFGQAPLMGLDLRLAERGLVQPQAFLLDLEGLPAAGLADGLLGLLSWHREYRENREY